MSVRSIQGRLAAQTRHHPDIDQVDLRREYAAEKIADFITRTVQSAPELTDEQRARLTSLLRSGGSDAA